MPGRCFVDTSDILHAASDAHDDADKRERALDGLDGAEARAPARVLREFHASTVRKGRDATAVERARRWSGRFPLRPAVPTDLAVVDAAIGGPERHRIFQWDAAIAAAAESIGAGILNTEDLNHGQRYGSVLVQTPFRDP